MFVFFSYIFSTCLFKRLFYIYLRWYVTYEMVTIPSEKCNVNVIIARYMCSYFLLSSLSDWNLFTFENVFVCNFPFEEKVEIKFVHFSRFQYTFVRNISSTYKSHGCVVCKVHSNDFQFSMQCYGNITMFVAVVVALLNILKTNFEGVKCGGTSKFWQQWMLNPPPT